MDSVIDVQVSRSEESSAKTWAREFHWSQMLPPGVFLVSDVLAFVIAFSVSGAFVSLGTAVGGLAGGSVVPYAAAWASAAAIAMAAMAFGGLYAPSFLDTPSRLTLRGLGIISFIGMGSMAAASLVRVELVAHAAFSWAMVVPLFIGGRFAATLMLRLLCSLGVGTRRVLVVGSGLGTDYATHKLESYGVRHRLAGRVDFTFSGDEAVLSRCLDELQQAIREAQPGEVLIAAPPSQLASIEEAIRPYIPKSITVRFALYPLVERPGTHAWDVLAGDFLTVRVRPNALSWRYRMVKRAMDISGAVLALVVFAPAMLMIALAIKLDSAGPVLFRQSRVGREGRTFTMYKFRSMLVNAESMQRELVVLNEAEGPLFKLRNDPRVTRVGRIIRKFSLDELPQLFNVLEGTMSLVGPRPALPSEVAEYEEWQLHRLSVLPGVTGLWQVNRRRCSSFHEMVWQDLEYVDNWSLGLDLQVAFKTVPAMLAARGAY